MNRSSRHLVFHGSLVLLFGLLLGAPYAQAIRTEADEQIINSWRMAHQSLPIGATLMFAVAAVLSTLTVSVRTQWVIAIALIVTAYAFSVSMPLAAMSGNRGLTLVDGGPNIVVYASNMLGALASLVAAVVLVYASAVSLRSRR